MADRTVTVRVRADVAQAKRELEALGYQVQDTGQRVESTSDAWEKVGEVASKAGAAGAAGLGLSAKAAIDWESAWAGVTKTVNGTDAQMAELESGLRGLASTTLPATHEEIAGVAEAAGQLGVKREDVLGFTKTMIDLGVSTNLTADEAATSLAQISNVMGTMTREGQVGVQRLGSTLVALGNAGASTEADIVQMAQRIAGAGAVVGASESDVLALANAMSSVGIEAQLGGGVMSRVMLKINSAVKSGGDELDAFAEVSGLSAEEFTKRWESDPVAAIDLFVKGLGQINASGGDAAGTLDDLGLKGTENASVLLRLVGAGDLLTESLTLGSKAWEENNALQSEAEKRYETTASKLKIARNAVNDAAISAGDVLLPAVTEVANAVGDLAKGFSDLDPGVQSTIVKLGALTAGLLLTVGGTIKLVKAGQSAVATMRALQLSALGASRGTAVAAKSVRGLVAAVAVLAAANVVDDLFGSSSDGIGSEQLTTGLLKNADAVAALDQAVAAYADTTGDGVWNENNVRSYADALNAAFDPSVNQKIQSVAGSVLDFVGIADQSDVARSGEIFKSLDEELSNLVTNGNAEVAADQFNQFAAAAEEQGVSVDELKAKMPAYAEALAGATNQQALGAETAGQMADGLTEVQTEAEVAEENVQGFKDALDDMNGVQLDARAAARDVAQAIRDAGEAAKEGASGLTKTKDAFDLTTEAGLENEAALDNVARAMNDQLKAASDAGASQQALDKTLRTSRDELYKTARRFGLNEEAARAYVEEVLGIPTARTTEVKINAKDAKAQAQRIQSYINGIHGKDVRINVRYNAGTLPNGGRDLSGGTTKGYATGGYHSGPGTGTSDQIPVWVSNGEYTLRAAAVQHYGISFLESVSAKRFASGGYHAPMPSSTPAGPIGPMELVGTLDLGDGLRGLVRGEVRAVASGAARSRG